MPGNSESGDTDSSLEQYWFKIADPRAEPPTFPDGADIRVLLPTSAEFHDLRAKLTANGVDWRAVRYLVDDEIITRRSSQVSECYLARSARRQPFSTTGPEATVAQDAFKVLWDSNAGTSETASSVPTERLVPRDWLRFLPYPSFNPAQAEAVPPILGDSSHVVVVAPTGAGKTTVGMVAALRAVVGEGRKAAWLVPQRSLTDELDRELDHWRREGLRVERLSGEYSVDVERVRQADVWVATTEKFEAMCRASSLREALAEVACLIVDEIHLLGDPERGPVLEALLARMRGNDQVRIVGLSATVANADEIAAWLGARLVRVAWRPSTLTWQLPVIATHRDWSLVESARIRVATALTGMVTQDGGSALVFCGSKRGVRRTALVIAGSRGVRTDGVHPDDLDRLHEVCREARIGLHYKGWDHKREAEKAFRAREIDVLVATSTVAAGVNLPARAVIVQDTEVGMNPIDVATVQQMFGRAGRVGHGERDGWAFLIVTEQERQRWQAKLVAGNTVRSRIEASLPDHVLAEVVQRRIGSLREAEDWWVGTLACHQGSRSLQPLREAVRFLTEGQFISGSEAADGEFLLAPTDLGKVTARLMVPAAVGHEIRVALAESALPDSPDEAERTVIDLIAGLVPKLAQSAINEELKTVVNRLLRPDGSGTYQRGDLARAALGLVASTPEAFRRGAKTIAGIPYLALYPVLEDAPRYLHWIGCQGQLGTVHPWSAVVAADLSRRVKWRRCQPPRGAGRLLWMCEQMATPTHAEDLVPALWNAARARGITGPDWSARGMPSQCRLDDEAYRALLKERATGVVLERSEDQIVVSAPDASVVVTWSGRRFSRVLLAQGKAPVPTSDDDTQVTVFTWRGDYRATGWLSRYSRTEPT
ncbi:DEAD/DEAH box helicase [Amycolatopsis orientalis]|uniref:DEAD/DEAH box helicase n=1 Tax=Amycolatopsis orientalis TaxID=31958 RepID=A0A193C507_AMYOR|nr:DEAD/DEAH box helicase [Amycolatopsis orientalis]ANN19534.1 DEAD/DEAH box helicase [Amycolatopsis orientalis]